jgi:hypothetical protein
MAKKKIRKATTKRSSDYPSLEEHMMSRRRFLELAGGCLAAGGLWAACGRPLGNKSEEEVAIPGDVRQPDYYRLRIPTEHELTSYLYDGGVCVFYVEVVTYAENLHTALIDELERAEGACRATISDFSYDQLDTGEGRAAAEDDLADSLEQLGLELTGQDLAVEALTLHIVSLEPYAPIDGGMPAPSYP